MRAATSAPMPRLVCASCTTTARPVLRTDSYTGAMSSGERVRRSITSTLVPSCCAAAADCRAVLIVGPYARTVTSVPSRTTREENRGAGVAVTSISAFSQYRAFGSKKITGSSESIACRIMKYEIGRATCREFALTLLYLVSDNKDYYKSVISSLQE